jgi:hypothetical protein
VTATLANTDTNYRTVTNESGNYVIPDIRPGEYTITADAPAFKRTRRSGVVIEVNQRARVDLALQVGDVQESVQVAADERRHLHRLQLTKRSIPAAYDLPLNGRALQCALPPGVAPASWARPLPSSR